MSNEEKQKSYARYLVKLPLYRRNLILSRMKPCLEKKMKSLIKELNDNRILDLARDIANFDPDVKALYLKRIQRNQNSLYQKIKPLVQIEESKLEGITSESTRKEKEPC